MATDKEKVKGIILFLIFLPVVLFAIWWLGLAIILVSPWPDWICYFISAVIAIAGFWAVTPNR